MAAANAARAASDRATEHANQATSVLGSRADEEVARLQEQLDASKAELASQQEANQKLQVRVLCCHTGSKRAV